MKISEFLRKLSLLNECVRARHINFLDTGQKARLLIFIGEIENLLEQELVTSLEETSFILTYDGANEYQLKERMK